VIIPIYPDIYEPALKELGEQGIIFQEEISEIATQK
jgi:hypothetical protein